MFPKYVMNILSDLSNPKRNFIIKILFPNKKLRFSKIMNTLNSKHEKIHFKSNKLSYHLSELEKNNVIKREIIKKEDNATIYYSITEVCKNLIQNILLVYNEDNAKIRDLLNQENLQFNKSNDISYISNINDEIKNRSGDIYKEKLDKNKYIQG